jgi:hypothetical protein
MVQGMYFFKESPEHPSLETLAGLELMKNAQNELRS